MFFLCVCMLVMLKSKVILCLSAPFLYLLPLSQKLTHTYTHTHEPGNFLSIGIPFPVVVVLNCYSSLHVKTYNLSFVYTPHIDVK